MTDRDVHWIMIDALYWSFVFVVHVAMFYLAGAVLWQIVLFSLVATLLSRFLARM